MSSVENPSFFTTSLGMIKHQDSLLAMRSMGEESVDLIITSPPFALVRKKEYGNKNANEYIEWFCEFAREFKRILKNSGSLVIDIGGSWLPGLPTRSLYHFKLVICLCEKLGFHMAQDFYWWNPSKLPTPAEWVTIRRIRVKDAINTVWWLSKTPYPKASNRRVLQPYSQSMLNLLENGYCAKQRPSGHDISDKFQKNNGAAIPPNLIAISNTESNSYYLRKCKERGIKPHPARFPSDLPEYFIRMLTDKGDFVFDPFGGSCVTGAVAERLGRKWVCCEIDADYIEGAKFRFDEAYAHTPKKVSRYSILSPASFWNESETPLSKNGGRTR